MSKKLEIYGTKHWANYFTDNDKRIFYNAVNNMFRKYPYDMFVFTRKDNKLTVRLAGYNFVNGDFNENLVVGKTTGTGKFRKFWFKIDDYGDRYVGTFLFPEEY